LTMTPERLSCSVEGMWARLSRSGVCDDNGLRVLYTIVFINNNNLHQSKFIHITIVNNLKS